MINCCKYVTEGKGCVDELCNLHLIYTYGDLLDQLKLTGSFLDINNHEIRLNKEQIEDLFHPEIEKRVFG